MDKYFIVGIVVLICIMLVIYTQNSAGIIKTLTFKQQVQKAYPKFKVIEKSGTIMICELNHRNELDELVFVRVDPDQKKNFRQFGRRITITYAKQPTIKELMVDAKPYLT